MCHSNAHSTKNQQLFDHIEIILNKQIRNMKYNHPMYFVEHSGANFDAKTSLFSIDRIDHEVV